MRTLRLALVGSLLSLPAVALAETPDRSPVGDDPAVVAPDVQGWMVSERPGRPSTVRQVLPASHGTSVIAHAGAPLIIYLNHTGVTLSPSNANDSRTNKSTLVAQPTAVPAWNTSAQAWSSIVSCVRTMYAPFNVTVTDQDPGNVPHMESVVTTLSSTIGMDPNVGGVSPYTIGCTPIDNSIVFTFADAFNGDPETVCEVIAQETAHSVGLDHEMLAADPMTYLQYNGLQAFRDQTVSCGEYQNRDCGLQGECGATQNSYQELMQRVGPAGTPNNLPQVAITSPSDGAQVPPGFSVAASAQDDGSVAKVELYVDGALVDTKTAGPYTFATSASLAEGAHEIQTIAYDDAGQQSAATINVTVANGAPNPDPGGDDNGAGGDQNPSELVGGCQTGGGTGAGGLLLLGITVGGLALRRRRG